LIEMLVAERNGCWCEERSRPACQAPRPDGSPKRVIHAPGFLASANTDHLGARTLDGNGGNRMS
jgi:hypothetical protein